jgi:hypothetical protein
LAVAAGVEWLWQRGCIQPAEAVNARSLPGRVMHWCARPALSGEMACAHRVGVRIAGGRCPPNGSGQFGSTVGVCQIVKAPIAVADRPATPNEPNAEAMIGRASEKVNPGSVLGLDD